jgi:hypothetical protein
VRAKQFADLITQAEAARLRGVTPVAIADLIRRGRLSAIEIAGRKHLRRSEVISFEQKPAGRPAARRSSKRKQAGTR